MYFDRYLSCLGIKIQIILAIYINWRLSINYRDICGIIGRTEPYYKVRELFEVSRWQNHIAQHAGDTVPLTVVMISIVSWCYVSGKNALCWCCCAESIPSVVMQAYFSACPVWTYGFQPKLSLIGRFYFYLVTGWQPNRRWKFNIFYRLFGAKFGLFKTLLRKVAQVYLHNKNTSAI